MKKTICLILTLFLCLSLCACHRFDNSYTEIWSCIDEFDDVDFDFEKYILDLQSDSTVSVELLDLGDYHNELLASAYRIIYGAKDGIIIYVCHDVDSAKKFYNIEKKEVSRVYTPYWSLVRINNIVFKPVPVSQSNHIMLDIMSELGIEDSYVLKIHTKEQVFRSFTKKSFDEIISEIESKGYNMIVYEQNAEDQTIRCSFVSEDGTDMYEIIACHNKDSNGYVLNYLSTFRDFKDENAVTQIYYTLGDDYSMLFFGNSIETRDFWNEIR